RRQALEPLQWTNFPPQPEPHSLKKRQISRQRNPTENDHRLQRKPNRYEQKPIEDRQVIAEPAHKADSEDWPPPKSGSRGQKQPRGYPGKPRNLKFRKRKRQENAGHQRQSITLNFVSLQLNPFQRRLTCMNPPFLTTVSIAQAQVSSFIFFLGFIQLAQPLRMLHCPVKARFGLEQLVLAIGRRFTGAPQQLSDLRPRHWLKR